jgi:transposase InsO family protein
MNAYAERFVRTIKHECLQRLVLIGERSLHRALRECVAHYNCERNHQGLGNRLICGGGPPTVPVARIATRRRLGGLLNFYHDAAAA